MVKDACVGERLKAQAHEQVKGGRGLLDGVLKRLFVEQVVGELVLERVVGGGLDVGGGAFGDKAAGERA